MGTVDASKFLQAMHQQHRVNLLSKICKTLEGWHPTLSPAIYKTEGVASKSLSPTHTHVITQFTSEGPRRLDISHRNVRNYKALKAVKKSLYHLQSKIKVSTPCEFMLMRLNLKKTLGVYQTCSESIITFIQYSNQTNQN